MTTTLTPSAPSPTKPVSKSSTGGRWWASSAGFVSIGAVLAITAGAFAALFGFGNADHTVQFLRGNAWLANDQTGSVVRVNGATGKPDFEMKLKGTQGASLQVIQGPDGVFVLNQITGEVTKLDDAQLKLGASIKSDPGNQPIFLLGGGNAFLVALRTGRVQQVDPKSAGLETVGSAIELGHAVANAFVDDGGRLIAATPATGEIAFVVGGRKDGAVKVAEPGAALTVSLVSDQLVAVDRTKGTAALVDPTKGVTTVFAIEAPRDGNLAVVDKMTGGRLWLVHVPTAELVGIDLRNGNQLHISLKDSLGNDLGAPLPNGNFVYVPDFAKGELVKVDTDTAAVVERVAVTGGTKGKFDSFVKDDRVWGNDRVGQLAVVIDQDGNARPVEKYRPGLPSNDDAFDAPSSTPSTIPKTTVPPASTTTTTQPETKSTLDPLDPLAPRDPLDPGTPGPDKPNPIPPTSTVEPGLPGAPTTDPASPPPSASIPGAANPVVATAGDGAVFVQWTAAADNGSPLTKYIVSEPTLGPRDIAGSETSVNVDGLANGTTYTFTVWAVNAIGDGPQSVSAPAIPQSSVAGAPENVVGVLVADPDAPTNLTAIRLTWDAPLVHPELVTEYDYACPEWGQSSVTPIRVPASTTSFSVVVQGQSHLTTQGYTCWVQSVDSASIPQGRTDLPLAATLWPFAQPGQCTALGHGPVTMNAGDSTLNDITLTWTPPTDDGGRGIESYEVEIEYYLSAISDYTHYVSLIAPGSASQIDWTGFQTGTYRYHIKARGVLDTPSGLQFFGSFSAYDYFS